MLLVAAIMLWLSDQGAAPLAPVAAPARARQETFAAISGRVRRADDNFPIHRARIVLTWSGGAIGPVFTDETGAFTMQAPANAGYVLHVSRAGFASVNRDRAPRTAVAWDIGLEAGAVLAGRVMGGDGFPEAGREVRLRQLPDGSTSNPRDIPAAETNDLGMFRFGGLAAGRYEVSLGVLRLPIATEGGPAVVRRRNSDNSTLPQVATLATGEAINIELQSDMLDLVTMVTSNTTAMSSGRISVNLTSSSNNPGNISRARTASQASIEGRVSSADGLALAGALVTAAPVGAGNVVTVRSDSEGAYEITQLPAGRYRVTVRRPGFIRWSYGQVDAMQSGRVLVLRANTQARKIDVTLPRSGVVSGTVTDRFGVPVEGVLLQLLEPRAVGGRQQLVAVAGITAKSDDLGQYRLAGVDPGSYYVRAIDETPPGAPPLVDSPGRSTFHPGHDTPEAALALPVDVGLDAAGTDIVFAPGPSARVSGEVFDSQGKPFTGDMTLATSSRNVSPLLESRSIQATDGRFEFLGVPPGDYVIQAVESTSTFNVASRLSRSSGTAAGLTAAQTETTSFGVAFVTVTSAADDPAPMSIAMSRGHTIRAQIAFNGSGLSTDSFTPTLVAVPADLDFTPRAGTPRPAVRALDDGTFEITNVVGPFRLALSAGGDGEWWLKRVKVDGVDVKDDPVTLSHIAPDDTELDVVVARNAATIGGRVVTASRQPVGSGSVLVFSTNPDDWYERSRYVRTAEAGENGQFTVGGLAPGDYWMVALDIAPPPAYKLSGEFLRRVASFATHVTLSEGQHRQTDLRPMKLPR